MQTVLISIEDPTLRDLVRTAFRIFPRIRTVSVSRERIPGLLSGGTVPVAVIVEYGAGKANQDPLIQLIRQTNRDIHVLACAEKPERSHLNRAKMDLGVFSIIPLPLDPFDLLRRLHRLVEVLPAA